MHIYGKGFFYAISSFVERNVKECHKNKLKTSLATCPFFQVLRYRNTLMDIGIHLYFSDSQRQFFLPTNV